MRLALRPPVARPVGVHLAAYGAAALFLTAATAHAEAAESEAPEAPEAPAGEGGEPAFERAGFSFDPHITAWLRADFDAPDDLDFSVPLLRPWFSVGVLDDRLKFRFKADFGGGEVELLDAYLDFDVSPTFNVAAGRFKTPFSRLWMTPTRKLQLPDRGVAVDEFELGRAAGVLISGKPARAFEYALGAVARDHVPVAVARFAITPYGVVPEDQTPSLELAHPSGMSIGVDGYFTAASLAGDDAENVEQSITGGADLEIVEGPFALLAEGFVRAGVGPESAQDTSYGAVVETSAFVVPRRLELVGRGSWLDPDVDEGDDFEQVYEAGLTAYLAEEPPLDGHHLKLAVRYRFDAAERAHRLTAQLQLFL
jgi:hypothetical protein